MRPPTPTARAPGRSAATVAERFPAIRAGTVAIAVAAAVAVAVAVGGDDGLGPGADDRSAIADRAVDTWTVTSGPFRAALVLDGTLEEAPPLTMPVDDTTHLTVPDGATVAVGDEIGFAGPTEDEILVARRALEDAVLALDALGVPEGDEAARRMATVRLERARDDLDRLEARRRPIVAAASGTLRRTSDGVVAVQPPGLAAAAGLTPVQALRLSAGYEEAAVAIRLLHGEVDVACPRPTFVSTSSASALGDGPAGAGTLVRCLLPDDLPAVPGLPVRITVTVADVPEAVLVPATAVRLLSPVGDDADVVTTDRTGQRVVRVRVGPSDGVRTVVTSGLTVGDVVLRTFPEEAAIPG